ncbi:catalase family peroxidase [Yersinia nurmii]|uniref:Catalase-related peroxidase n=1 Tax=Yersinia nurmii TaxID=685706 RepID=A0AAW7K1E1_9GAMM|nr:catalase family peroxidase [Yersinia nurmii]MDN0089152.1 catalase family peroxidase [Yersinia nurmii]CNF04493.1 catalase [Yersinia nurmii]
MRKVSFSLLSCLITFGCLPSVSGTVPQEINAEQMVNALNDVFGRHSKQRASHAKGFCFSGKFIASGEGTELSQADLLRKNEQSDVVGRFSIGGGNPQAADNAKNLRGLAFELVNTKHSRWQLVMISSPFFFARTPQEFIEFLKARTPDPETGKPNPERLNTFNQSHPHTLRQAQYVASQPVPASYATIPYWGGSTFITYKDQSQYAVRWRMEPVEGRQGLSDEQAKAKSPDFLQEELRQRLAKGPIEYDLYAIVAQKGDNLIDPTQSWPAERREVNMGRLFIETVTDQQCDKKVFIPTVLPQGIRVSDDPTLAVRAEAYLISTSRRQ